MKRNKGERRENEWEKLESDRTWENPKSGKWRKGSGRGGGRGQSPCLGVSKCKKTQDNFDNLKVKVPKLIKSWINEEKSQWTPKNYKQV